MQEQPPTRGANRDALPEQGLRELARRLMNAARRATECEWDAEELVSDGFARSFCSEQPIAVGSPSGPSRAPDSAERPKTATRYAQEAPDIVERCARPREQRSADDERIINSFVWRLTMTTRRHLWRKRAKAAARENEFAEHYAVAVFETIEEELCRWTEDDKTINQVLDGILTEISEKPKNKHAPLKERLRSELTDSGGRVKNKDIAAKHGIKAATLSSDWNRLLFSVIKKEEPC